MGNCLSSGIADVAVGAQTHRRVCRDASEPATEISVKTPNKLANGLKIT